MRRHFSTTAGRSLLLLIVVAVLTLFLLVFRGITTVSWGGVTLRPLAALVVAGGFVFGIVPVVGVAIGYLFFLATGASFAPLAILPGFELILLGLGATTIIAGRSLSSLAFTIQRRPRFVDRWVIIAGIGLVACVSATLGLGYLLIANLDIFPFGALVAIGLGVSLLVLTVPLVALSLWLRDRSSADEGSSTPRPEDTGYTRRVSAFCGFSLLWLLVGSSLSAGYHAVELLPAATVRRRGLDILLMARDPQLVGHGARTIQIAIGGVFLTLIVLSGR